MVNTALRIISIIISCFISVFTIFHFMEGVFQGVYKQRFRYYFVFMGGWFIFTLTNLMGYPILNLGVSLLLIFVIGIWLYGAVKSSDILIFLLFSLFLVSTEVIGQLIMSVLLNRPFSNLPGNIVQSLFTFCCLQIVLYLTAKSRKEFNISGNFLTLVFIPGVSIFLVFAIVNLIKEQSGNTDKIYALTSCVLIFIVNIVVFLLFNRIAVLNQENQQYALQEQQKQLQFKYFKDLEQKYEESRKVFHDIKNHLNTIDQLYQHEDTAASSYSAALGNKIDGLDIASTTRNRILNILIHEWSKKAEENHITFKYQCEDIELSFIAGMDLNTILTNLMDNAFEECIGNDLEHNEIELNICQMNHFIIFNISNSCQNAPVLKGQQYLSLKVSHMGLGLNNVMNAAANYDGTMNINYENQRFTVQITFFGREEEGMDGYN